MEIQQVGFDRKGVGAEGWAIADVGDGLEGFARRPSPMSSCISARLRKRVRAVTNVGNRPTFGADSFTVESHLLIPSHRTGRKHTTHPHISQRLRRDALAKSRALREQIGRDVAKARRTSLYVGPVASQRRSSAPQRASLVQ